MVSEKIEFDLGADFADSNYKSWFARSIAVSSSQSQKQLSSAKSLQVGITSGSCNGDNGKGVLELLDSAGDAVVVKLRKPLGISADDNRRYSYNSGSAGSRRTSICSSRITEVPDVETVLLQSQVDTLQWQLKQTLESRKMYRNVMKQVVTFLDRAHKNLQLLGKKLNTTTTIHQPPSTVARSKSEHHVNGHHSSVSSPADYESISWRQKAAESPSPDEVPPDKLSQEAFRLLRTVQSLLNTREPDLSSTSEPQTTISPTPSDIDFLHQLAKEFPSQESPHRTPNRTTSFSLSPKLLTPEKDNPNHLQRIATAFNRKHSLQLHDTKRTMVSDEGAKLAAKFKLEKGSSPPVSTVSSVEDESGFSSLSSFQEVGVPIAADDPRMVLMKSMLYSGEDERGKTIMEDKCLEGTNEGLGLWHHKRWSGSTVDAIGTPNDKQGMKVLWV